MHQLRRPSRCLGGRGAAAIPFSLGLLALSLLPGCHGYRDCCGPDWEAPAPPREFWSVTGDHQVELVWTVGGEPDLAGYRIYRSRRPEGYFPRLATVGPEADHFMDWDVQNGATYYYAISAFDGNGNESELARDVVHDTPRPEGFRLSLNNSQELAAGSGYDFSTASPLDYRDLEADVYYWAADEAGAWMIATERSPDVYTDIQDAGYVPLDAIDFAPDRGWATSGEVPLIEGHSYIVWTWDDHFAKFRVVALYGDRVVLDWAYQTNRGNIELSLPGANRRNRQPDGGVRQHLHGMERRISS